VRIKRQVLQLTMIQVKDLVILWLIVVRIVKSETDTFSCREHASRADASTRASTSWYYELNDQAEMDQFILAVETNSTKTLNDVICIEVSVTNSDIYKIDILKLMTVNLGSNGSLIIIGVADHVVFDCTMDQYDLDELRNLFKPLTGASLIVLDRLVFIACPVPFVIEETKMVVIQNCVFL